ncbi:LPS-assembly protein LptD [Desulfobacter hydrogenophilus]|uniref:LPS-assembly protein LptD n=1 Tax=Desulfobacter hydrogenophilus TaxID=2291 RepID=A0A328FJW6_9BACT|nr:LPS assembly protein LptD [Desulfobacter hydrogenophilus]NDY70889.1 LPS-assembly protein LptD [Desulfobacter hydrogenophilus]QBH11658.1 LPS-assembly protein LptD [Desulfobacter hydrogenophilus]RAM03205.1 LPS-assembly protein LptD [Desulfobacter hydrogenophilus]
MVSCKRVLCQICIVPAVIIFLSGQAFCFSASMPTEKVSWHIQARQVSYEDKRKLYIAENDVVITGGKTRLEADYVEFSDITKDAFAKGNVLFISGKDTITCKSMNVNLSLETGTINQGTIFIQDGNYYISGDKLRKTGEFTYDAEKGSITTCEGKNPDWKITGKDIGVTVDGFGHASHAVLWAKKMPTFYAPYFIFPTKTTRQTGLLTPMAGYSDDMGFEYQQPLFLALSDSTDATFYPYYMSDRGVMLSGEYRYILSPESKGMIMMSYLNDETIGDDADENEDYNISATPDRTNHDRYWFRMKHNQELWYGFNAKLDIDYVSDMDYLRTFTDGFAGFDSTDAAFEEMFGRDLDEETDYIRENSLLVTKNWSSYSLNMEALWYDNIEARQTDIDDTTLQTLPSVEFFAARQKIAEGFGLYYKMDSELTSFYRQDTTDTEVTGRRADVHPIFYYPIKFGKSFFIEPYAGVRGTLWDADDFTDSDGDDSNVMTRGLYEMGVDMSTTLSRVFTLDTDFAEKIQHKIVPRLEYDYIPFVDQEDLPYFNAVDDISEENIITWSLTNTFTSRKTITDENGEESKAYKELFWFKLSQGYDIWYEQDEDDAEDDPWQDLTLKYELNPLRYLSSNGTIALDPNNGHFTKIQVGGTISDNRGDSISLSYRYSTDYSHTWKTTINTNLVPDILKAFYSVEQDLEDQKTVETSMGISINQPCWGVNLAFIDESADKSFAFMVILKGIGGFGTQ